MSFPKSIPKRSPDKNVVIDLGDARRVKLDSSRRNQQLRTKRDLQASKINLTENETERKKPRVPPLHLYGSASSSSSKNVHRLELSPHPRILTVNQDRQNAPSSERRLAINRRNVEVSIRPDSCSGTRMLTEIVEDLLSSKKAANQGSGALLKRLVNRNVRKTLERIPHANLNQGVRHWDFYEGETLDNMMHGHGRLSYINGQSFTGYFVKGVANGNGTFYEKDGKAIIGIWKAGRLIKRLA